ncbi:MAG: ABC transporter ATP-binding protein [Deltaproteobacteria bacterium]|nr:ABC transporter ATP-binding protein [Deltaproteobacteria bacterium]MBW2633242.1 ABC transporter ATP-binding protein [Deltaproteobacteria bacterium]MBW2677255.1 ABC transporter ATP-binding protein [Deltaproteobacteria bacterium]
MNNKNLLDILHLQTHFFVRGQVAKAVDDINLSIKPGKTLGLVGESGCGKSVTAHSIIQLIPDPPGRIVGGEIRFNGTNLLELSEKEMRKIRGNRISMIFQEPMTSLNPVFSVGDQVGEVIRLHRNLSSRETHSRVVDMFKRVGIPAAEKRLDDYPHQMSGGMRQRVMIAMALACNPQLMIADEPTTALDVTIQAQILDLMNTLKSDTGASILFITHDLGVIAEMAQHVAVMYAGRVMEYADAESLFLNPKHPYTVGLMESIPILGRGDKQKRLPTISGVVPSLFELPDGCLFSDRCPDVFADCRKTMPHRCEVEKNHIVRCLKYA